MVYTKSSKIAGRLATAELDGDGPKGPMRLRIADLRTLASPEADDIDISKAIPDPGNLTNYQNQPGKAFVFKVTGRTAGGFVWGTDVYTTDSTLAMAAVHAGVLKAGQAGYVRVAIVALAGIICGLYPARGHQLRLGRLPGCVPLQEVRAAEKSCQALSALPMADWATKEWRHCLEPAARMGTGSEGRGACPHSCNRLLLAAGLQEERQVVIGHGPALEIESGPAVGQAVLRQPGCLGERNPTVEQGSPRRWVQRRQSRLHDVAELTGRGLRIALLQHEHGEQHPPAHLLLK